MKTCSACEHMAPDSVQGPLCPYTDTAGWAYSDGHGWWGEWLLERALPGEKP